MTAMVGFGKLAPAQLRSIVKQSSIVKEAQESYKESFPDTVRTSNPTVNNR
jgi:hypothetical protein